MAWRRACGASLVGLIAASLAWPSAAVAARGEASFERWVPPAKLHTAEEQALIAVRRFARDKAQRFRLDRRLIRAARATAASAADATATGAEVELLRAEAHRWGWTDGQLAVIAVPQFDTATLAEVLAPQLAQQLAGLEFNRVGVGAATVGDRRLLLLAFSRRLVNLMPTPAQVEPGAVLKLSGWLAPAAVPPTATLALVAQLPSGQTVRPVVERHQRRFEASLELGRQPGLARVQWLLDRGRGPEIAAQAPINVGHAAAPPTAAAPPNDTIAGDDDPTSALTGLILGAREAEGQSLPMYSAALAELARRHAEDMRDHAFFAHVSPTTGDLDQRLRRRGLGFVRAVENLALTDSAAGAFHQWMQSPAHRANLLEAQATALGVGMVEGRAANQWYAVAVLARFADDGSDHELRNQAAALVNLRRQALRLPRLRRDPALEALAARHSRETALLGELTDVSPIRGRLVDTVLDEVDVDAAAADVFLAGTVDVVSGAAHLAEPFARFGVGVHRDRQRAGAQLWITVVFARD